MFSTGGVPLSFRDYVSISYRAVSRAAEQHQSKILSIAFAAIGVWWGSKTVVKSRCFVRQCPGEHTYKATAAFIKHILLGVLITYDCLRTSYNSFRLSGEAARWWNRNTLGLHRDPSMLRLSDWARVFWGDEKRNKSFFRGTFAFRFTNACIFAVKPHWNQAFRETQEALRKKQQEQTQA